MTTAPSSSTTRALPGPRGRCRRCAAAVVWAVTVAGPNGPGGKSIPLDVNEHPEGNVAVRVGHGGRVHAQVLTKGEAPDQPLEYRGMPHFATCVASRATT